MKEEKISLKKEWKGVVAFPFNESLYAWTPLIIRVQIEHDSLHDVFWDEREEEKKSRSHLNSS